VNSGNYDWVLAEITQASEYEHSEVAFDGLARTRQSDPEFTSEVLEDRASLVFWKWIEAQVVGDASRLSKVATVGFAEKLKSDLTALDASGRQKVFLECAVGAVNTMAVSNDGERERASVEIRWSAKSGLAAKGQKPPAFPSVPQRWVFVLERKAGAQTSHDQGLSTNRCPQCHAPLSDNGQTSCEYCSTPLASGEREWVLSLVTTWEAAKAGAPHTQLRTNAARTYDREERERLLYLMASVAVADGSLDAAERKLLRMCAERWDVAWANVELALNAGPGLFDRLIAKGSEEAESFIRELVQMALVDGQIDRKERKLLETAATHLGLGARLNDLVNRATQQRSS
jgi:tellurite resistance protein